MQLAEMWSLYQELDLEQTRLADVLEFDGTADKLIAVCKANLEKAMAEYTAATIEFINEVYARIENPLTRRILIMRYARGMTFAQIAAELHYSKRYVSRLHQRGKVEFVKGAKSNESTAEKICE